MKKEFIVSFSGAFNIMAENEVEAEELFNRFNTDKEITQVLESIQVDEVFDRQKFLEAL